MGIGSVASTGSASGIQLITAVSTDPKSKSIKNEIANAQQQLQKLSSEEDLSVNEKADEQNKLQKEISSLNTDLKQHQDKLSSSQKREIMLAESREDPKPEKEIKTGDNVQTDEKSPDREDEKDLPAAGQQEEYPGTVITQNNDGTVILKEKATQTDAPRENGPAEKNPGTADSDFAADPGLSPKKMHSMVSADSSIRLASRQGTVIARTRDGIAILKGEINQDEKRGVNTERKQAELEKMEKKEQQALAFQSSILGAANDTARSGSGPDAGGIRVGAENNAFINAMRTLQEEDPTSQQRFHIFLTS